jgi:hypothetical protein
MGQGLKRIKKIAILIFCGPAINFSNIYVWVFVNILNGILEELLTLSSWLINWFKFVVLYDLACVQNMHLTIFFFKHF